MIDVGHSGARSLGLEHRDLIVISIRLLRRYMASEYMVSLQRFAYGGYGHSCSRVQCLALALASLAATSTRRGSCVSKGEGR